MSQERIKIRKTIVDLLVDATDAGRNVFAARTIPHIDDDLSVINVYTKSESLEKVSDSPKSYFRDLSTIIEIIVDNPLGSEANDEADTIADQVELIMDQEDQNANGILGCLVESAELGGVDTDWISRGDRVVCSVRMTYTIRYVKDAATIIDKVSDEAKKIGADWDIGTANDPDPEAKDIITLRV